MTNKLTPTQQALLQNRLRHALASVAAPPTIQPRPDPTQFPLSFAQERFWFLHQINPESAAYNRPAAFVLQGALDILALEHALAEMIRRHEILRVTFPSRDGQAQQVILPPAPVQLPIADLSSLPQPQRHDEARRLARDETRRPFSLTASPPWRASLLRLASDRHVLLLPTHHIISDGWSSTILLRELTALYAAFVCGEASPLPELPIQYADFAHWQRRSLHDKTLEPHLSYWMRQLADLPPPLDLPPDHPRPPVETDHGQDLRLALPASLGNALQALAHTQDATLFMTLLAAFQILLYRHTGQEDIVVGSAVAGRGPVETEVLIGCFVNTLALRANLSGNPTFRQLLATVRQTSLDAYQHSDLPFEKLLATLNPTRDLSRAPVFQVMFNSHLLPEPEMAIVTGLTVSRFPFDSGIAQFDLVANISREHATPAGNHALDSSPASGTRRGDYGELVCTFKYNTDLFNEATINRLLDHYRTLLEGIAADPGQRISYLPLLTPAEHQRILVEWNRYADVPATGRDTLRAASPEAFLPRDLCLHQLVEAQVQRTPQGIALVSGERHYTYDQLNVRANLLAHDLIRHGVGPDVPVGVFLDHEPEVLLAVLAILKAGGAYVPLNPEHPPERLAFFLRDTGLRCVLTLSERARLLPPGDFARISVALDGTELQRENASNPTTAVTPDHLAYILYTSGSTGMPRGVPVTHRAVANLLAYDAHARTLGPGCRVLNVMSLSFDPTARDLIVALAFGATLYIASRETILSPAALLETMQQEAITHASFPTSLLAALPAPELPALRMLNVGGEACPSELVRDWAPGRHLFNVYGPTEATIHTTRTECVADGSKPTIGRPIPNTRAYILDRHLQPLPIGVTGELYLAGACLARGYLNRLDVTAERFIPDPFSTEPGARMYRTGDLARYLPDGNIDFIGRADYQVKVRTCRVEPGEIEAALQQHPAVYQAVVLARQDRPGDTRLVAYVVARPGHTPTIAQLLDYVHQVLPQYMVPSAIVLLDSMPLTSNGKVDRRALPPPGQGSMPATEDLVAPRTPLETLVADLWCELLGLQQVGVHDNFFQIGGHSLLAVQMMVRLQSRLGIAVPVRALFESPTVAGLALALLERLAGRDQHTTNSVQ